MNKALAETLWNADDLVEVLQGRWLYGPPDGIMIRNIGFGTQRILSDSLQFTTDPGYWGKMAEDSRRYVREIFDKGATVVVTNEIPFESFSQGTPLLLVEGSTFNALERLAQRARERFTGTVVAVAGSAGKSSTVEMMKAAVGDARYVNSRLELIGKYSTLLTDVARLDPSAEQGFFKIEVPSWQKQLEILSPDVLVITNIDVDYVSMLDQIKTSQPDQMACDHYARVLQAVRDKTTVVISDYDYKRLGAHLKGIEMRKVVRFGTNDESDVRLAEKVLSYDGSYLSVHIGDDKLECHLSVPGIHMANNCLAVLATCWATEQSCSSAVKRLETFSTLQGRGSRQIVPWANRHITIIDETINSNLASAKALLEAASLMQPTGPGKVILAFGFIDGLAGMREQIYTQIAEHINASEIKTVFFFGEGMVALKTAIKSDVKLYSANNMERLVLDVLRVLQPGDVLLVKGGRRSAMERLVNRVSDIAKMKAGLSLSVSLRSKSSRSLWTPAELARITGGKWLGKEPENLFLDGVSVDKSNASDRTLVILCNPKSWGQYFQDKTDEIIEYFIKGAAAVITDTEPTDSLCQGLPILLVADTRPIPAELARIARGRLNGKVVGVTGSVGKTTTCEMLAHALGEQGESYKITRNRNTTRQTFCNIAETPPDTDFAVYEIGGHYEAGTKSVVMQPHIAVITGIGHAHASFFEEDMAASVLKQTAESKKHLMDGLLNGGMTVLARESEYYDFLSEYFRFLGHSAILSFGEDPDSFVRLLSYKTGLYGSQVRVSIGNEVIEYSLAVPGKHNIMNSMAALAAAYGNGADWKAVARALGSYRAIGGRDRIRRFNWNDGEVDVFDGSYSASVESIEAMVEMLDSQDNELNDRRKLVVIGDLDRGGKRASVYFDRLAQKLNRLNNVKVFSVGSDAHVLSGYIDDRLYCAHAPTAEEIVEPLLKEIRSGDIIAVKGAHELRLWKPIKAIQDASFRKHHMASSNVFVQKNNRDSEVKVAAGQVKTDRGVFAKPDDDKPVLWSSEELQTILGGQWVGPVSEKLKITGVNYYVGQVEPGDMAITTEPETWRSSKYRNTNENIATLINKKQAAVVVAGQLPSNYGGEHPLLLVKDTRLALDALGKAARDRMKGTVIAITGSAGKTTTKEITHFLLSQQGSSKGSRKNYNHGPGVPLMLAETPPDTRFGVYEFSVDLPNVTKKKAKILRPHVAVLTNIYPDHLEFYGTLEKLTDHKCMLFNALEPEGSVVLNRDSKLFERQLSNAKAAKVKHIVTFGTHPDADMRVVKTSLHAESSDVTVAFKGREISFHFNQPGIHLVMDCLGALASVHVAGGDWIKAVGDIEKTPALGRRNEQYEVTLSSGKVTLIDDTFSANPASIEAGLGVLGLTIPERGGRRIAVLGEIKELGETSAQLHGALAPFVKNAKVDVLFTIGRDLENLWRALPKDMQGLHGEDPDHVTKAVLEEMRGGDILWVKGSRRSTANLELVLSGIKKAGKSVRKHSEKSEVNESAVKNDRCYPRCQQERSAPIRIIEKLKEPTRFETIFVGDTAFGENYQAQYEGYGDGNILKERGYDAPLRKVNTILMQADLVVANLETPLTDMKVSPLAAKKSWVHWGDIEKTPHHLLANNISVVGLANNHMFDYGEDGFFQTLDSLEKAGITYFGGGSDIEQAAEAFVVQSRIEDKLFTLAMISMYSGPSPAKDSLGVYAKENHRGLNPASFKQMAEEIGRLRKEYPDAFIILFPHWGQNYKWRSGKQLSMAKRMTKLGVDLVLGHGAHMLQEIEKHNDRWVIYSVGNFMFNSKGRYQKLGAPPYSLMAKLCVEMDSGDFKKSLRLYPIVTDNRKTDYMTRPVTKKEFGEVISMLKQHYTDVNEFDTDVVCDKEVSKEGTRYYIALEL